MQNLQYFILFAGAWALINGILHDIFVLKEKKPFDRDLIRILIYGHILIFSGIFYLIGAKGILQAETTSFLVCICTSLFLLGYCFFIFKILPSFGTIIINLIALIWLLVVFI